MLKVGLTGGLGSGKSTASKFFNSLGAYVLDADSTAKNLIESIQYFFEDLGWDYQDLNYLKYQSLSNVYLVPIL